MIRTLITVAIVGFVLSIVAISTAFGIAGGPFAIHDWAIDRGSWAWGSTGHHHWRHHHGDEDAAARRDGDSAAVTRDFNWSGSDHLMVEPTADIVFTQGPVTKLTIHGPADALDHLKLADGHIRYDSDFEPDDTRLKIIMTAPGVRMFDLAGSQNLVIEGYAQDAMSLDISGDGRVSAKGVVKTLNLDITGAGRADLADLAVQDARIDMSGSSLATVGPKGSAKIDVSGSGEVRLTVKPKSLTQDISGSGRVSQPGLPG